MRLLYRSCNFGMEIKMKRILVTGGAGFLGSNLCKRLIKEGNHVICVDNLYTGRMVNIEELMDNPEFEFINHNIIEPLDIDNLDEIYNLAAQSHVQVSFDAPEYTGDVDAVGVPQAQLREFLAVDFGARHEDALRGELAVDGVPVDVLRIPVLLFLLPEDQAQCVGLARGGDHEDDVVFLQRLVGGGNRNLPFAPDPRNDEVVVALRSDLVDAFAEAGLSPCASRQIAALP